MTRMWAVEGDSTTSGGRVVTGSPFTDIDGSPVARIGDSATCPKHNGTFPIVDGDPTTIIDGQPVALHGSRLACGCGILAVRQTRVHLEASGVEATEPPLFATPTTLGASPDSFAAAYDEAFVLRAESGEPLVGRAYRIVGAEGRTEEGVTDGNGRTHLLASQYSETLVLELKEEGP